MDQKEMDALAKKLSPEDVKQFISFLKTKGKITGQGKKANKKGSTEELLSLIDFIRSNQEIHITYKQIAAYLKETAVDNADFSKYDEIGSEILEELTKARKKRKKDAEIEKADKEAKAAKTTEQ